MRTLLKTLVVAESVLCIVCALLAVQGVVLAWTPPPEDPYPIPNAYWYAAFLFAGMATLFALAARHLHRTQRVNTWWHLAPFAFYVVAFAGLLWMPGTA